MDRSEEFLKITLLYSNSEPLKEVITHKNVTHFVSIVEHLAFVLSENEKLVQRMIKLWVWLIHLILR